MKKFILILIVGFSMIFHCHGQSLNNIPIDHQQHFAVAYILSSSITAGTFLITKDKKKSIAIGFMSTILLAATKELIDSNGSGRSTSDDFFIGALGAGIATITISITL